MAIKTKIICTIGPSVKSLDKVIALIQAGMNVARLNFSHGTHQEHLETIQLLKEARQKLQTPLAIMLDTKGPEVRLGKIKNKEFAVLPGHQMLLVPESIEGDETKVSLSPGIVLNKLQEGTKLLFDDGYIMAKVLERKKEGVLIGIENTGVIRSGKGVCVLDLPLDRPRPHLQSFNGSKLNFSFSDSLSISLRSLAVDLGATLFMLSLAAFNVLLKRDRKSVV